MATQILLRAINQIFQNWRTTLRISWAWIMVFLIYYVAVNLLLAGSPAQLVGLEPVPSPSTVPQAPPILAFLLLWIIGIVFFVTGCAAIAIAWHRHILRDDEVGPFYLMNGDWPNGPYIGAAIKFGLIYLLIIAPISFVHAYLLSFLVEALPSSEITALSSGQPNVTVSLFTLIGGFVLSSIMTWVSLRFGLVLPCVAVGNKMPFGDAFYETAPVNGALIRLSLIIAAMFSVPAVIADLMAFLIGDVGAGPIFVVLGLVVQLFFVWFSTFLGIGMLTVLYGHLIEERPL